MPDRTQRVVISGCSSGGKSMLLAVLAARGCAVFEEPGRAIVKEQLASGGDALPWLDAGKFAQACLALGLEHWTHAAVRGGVAFFDRSMLDALNALERIAVPVPAPLLDALARRYHDRVFMAPPWPEIFAADTERRHSFADAVAEFETLQTFYARHGYEIVLLPKASVEARADFVLANIGV